MLQKEITRKQFLLSIISFAGVLVFSKVPKKMFTSSSKVKPTAVEGYGSGVYGANINA